MDAVHDTVNQNGGKIQVWDCDGSPEQQWTMSTHAGNGTIRNDASGKCLDAVSDSIDEHSSSVQLWDCDGSAEQQWSISQHDGDYWIYSKFANGRALNVIVAENGSPVLLVDLTA